MEIVTIWQLVAWKENVKVTAWRIGSGQCHKKWHGFVLYPRSTALCSAPVLLKGVGIEISETHHTSLTARSYHLLNLCRRSCGLCHQWYLVRPQHGRPGPGHQVQHFFAAFQSSKSFFQLISSTPSSKKWINENKNLLFSPLTALIMAQMYIIQYKSILTSRMCHTNHHAFKFLLDSITECVVQGQTR